MAHIGSNEDSDRLCGVGKNIQSLKSRLWEGITPLSDQRWKEKSLHLPENFDQACQHLSAVVAVFEYLNVPRVQKNLRVTFNLIYDRWEELDKVINQRRAETGADKVSVANLWTLYMTAHLELISQRAHKWVTQHVDVLRAPLMQELLAYRPSVETNGVLDEKHWKLGDALHVLLEISVQADHTIMIPMEGYKGYTARENGSGPSEMYAADHTERRKAYAQYLKSRSHQISSDRFQQFSNSDNPKRLTLEEILHGSAMDQVDAQKQVRRELRGDSIGFTLQEPWIASKLSRMETLEKNDLPKNSGLAIYRLTYGQSEQEWQEFVKNMENHISDWGTGQAGSDAIKPYLKLHWVDGRELGFAEGDIEAAKRCGPCSFQIAGFQANNQSRHFNEILNGSSAESLSSLPLQLESNAFLAIDSASFTSYTNNSYDAATSAVLPGDSTGFLLAVDPNFDADQEIERPEESPDYNGQMRVLGSLVWGDLYALLESQSARLPELWPLAMHHPEQVYVGPTIPLQRFHWQSQKEGQWKVLSDAMNYVGKIFK